jgi:mRNA-degrading endonuclease RelE of RelBE toxin-antitoxin system
MPLSVWYSSPAATQISEMKARSAASPGSSNATVWNGVRRILQDALTNPVIAFARDHGCREGQHDFGNVFRFKVGRYRIFYIGSSTLQRLIVLFIGYRKDGDKHDAYAELSRRLKSTEFDDVFKELGVKKPKG